MSHGATVDAVGGAVFFALFLVWRTMAGSGSRLKWHPSNGRDMTPVGCRTPRGGHSWYEFFFSFHFFFSAPGVLLFVSIFLFLAGLIVGSTAFCSCM